MVEYDAPAIVIPNSGANVKASEVKVGVAHDVSSYISTPYTLTLTVVAYDMPKESGSKKVLGSNTSTHSYIGGAGEPNRILVNLPLTVTDAYEGARTTVYLYADFTVKQSGAVTGQSARASRTFYTANTLQLASPSILEIVDSRGFGGDALASGNVMVKWFDTNDGVTGTVTVRAVELIQNTTVATATYRGALYGNHEVTLDLSLENMLSSLASVPVLFELTTSATGFVKATATSGRKNIAKAPICEIAILGKYPGSREYEEIRDLPVIVSGRLYDYVDGLGGTNSIRLTIYNRLGNNFEVPRYETEIAVPPRDDDGRFTISLGNEYPFENHLGFDVTLTSTNSVGLLTYVYDYAYAEFATPSSGRADFIDHLEDGSVEVVYYPHDGGGDAIPARGDVYAEKPDGSMKLIGSWTNADLDDDGAVRFANYYAPLNKPMRYRFDGVSGGGEQVVAENRHALKSQLFYMNWELGGQAQTVTSGEWNPEGSWQGRPADVELIHYMGRKYPVMSRSAAVDETISLTWLELEQGGADDFRRLAADVGRCYFRAPDGVVCNAYVEASGNPEYTSMNVYGTVSATLTRIDGDIR